jgi:beta-lactamase class A
MQEVAMRELRRKLWGIARRLGGTVGLVVQHLDSGEELLLHPDEVFPAASVIKIAILAEAMRQVEAGTLTLNTTVRLAAKDVVGGSGVLLELHPGLELTVEDLLRLMIVVSDNTASNLLINRLWLENVALSMVQWGLTASKLRRKFFDYTAQALGLDNFITPREMARLLGMMVRGELPRSQAMLDLLARCQDRSKMALYFPEEQCIAHKSGEIEGVRHDVGVVYTAEAKPRPLFIFCALTKGQADVVATDQAIGRLCRLVYDYVVEETRGHKGPG